MLPQSSLDHYTEQQRFSQFAAASVAKWWGNVGDDFDASWYPLVPFAGADLRVAQSAAAVTSAAYMPAYLADTGVKAPPVGDVVPSALVGVNRYGESVEDVLTGATTVAKSRVAEGLSPALARESALAWLTTSALTMVSDTSRSLVSADLAQRPALSGYIRMLNAPSCNRCIILAGKWFRWNEGFRRHPRCDCRHVPAQSEGWAKAEGFYADPYEYFKAQTEAEQNRLFGEADAKAIRDGGDIYRVTNTRVRGLADDVMKRTPGHNRGWQARKYGTPSKMTIDDIYAQAGNDRQLAVSLMEREGFITGPQVVGGNIKGRYFEGYAGAMGRGGARKGAARAFQQAQITGIRDPYSPDWRVSMDPATQTAGERRLHSTYLNQRAVNEGRNPFAGNSKRNPLTPAVRQTVETDYRNMVADLPTQPEQIRRLARLLGVI